MITAFLVLELDGEGVGGQLVEGHVEGALPGQVQFLAIQLLVGQLEDQWDLMCHCGVVDQERNDHLFESGL